MSARLTVDDRVVLVGVIVEHLFTEFMRHTVVMQNRENRAGNDVKEG
jgi:hypothetical protein